MQHIGLELFNKILEKDLREKLLDSEWERSITAIKNRFFPYHDIDLTSCYIRLLSLKENPIPHPITEALLNLHNDRIKIRKIMELEGRKLSLLNELSKITRNQIANSVKKSADQEDWCLDHYFHDSKLALAICSSYLGDNQDFKLRKSKNLYHGARPFIMSLILKFHEVTGNTPECVKHDRSTEEYGGEVYDFLLASRPLLKRLSIDLGTDMSIGRTAQSIIKSFKGIID